MDDLISRKAAIDAIMDADVCVTWNGVISDDDAVDIAIKSTKGSVISSIVNMPPAQPEKHTHERTETHACDLISRQAAIDAVYKCADIFVGDMPVMVVKADAYEALAQLPSAQPQQKKGKWIPLQLSMAHPPYQCSCCFRNAPMVETGCLVNRHLEALLTDWCPWRGADMREPEDIPMEYFESGGR